MRIAVTSQNFRTVTGHAGKARRFMIFETAQDGRPILTARLDLEKQLSIHEHPATKPHPIDGIDVLISAGCGAGFVRKLAGRGIKVVLTGELDPMMAAAAVAAGSDLPAPMPDDNEPSHECGCGCHERGI